VKVTTSVLVPPGVVTSTLTAPAEWAAVVQLMEVLVTLVTAHEEPPRETVVSPTAKFVPLIVTDVPPAAGPLLGLMPVTVGTAYAA
jgi:hypothetical protein